jgi:hypothetical protein
MARKPIEQQIAQLEARAKTLKARLARQDRARDTRRKILIGALVLHRLEHNGDGEFAKRLGDWLRRELPGFLSREDDKALFADLLNGKADAAAQEAASEKADT